MTDREKFEAWFMAAYPKSKSGVKTWTGEDDGNYISSSAASHWKAWQAALASQQPADDGATGVISDEQSALLKDAAREIISDDAWIEWSGGECPVDDDAYVEYRMRYGQSVIRQAKLLSWKQFGFDYDIIAYRVVKP